MTKPSDPQARPQTSPVHGPVPDQTGVAQPNNPLHGLTLQVILTELQSAYGWAGLAERIPVRCFQCEPSITSSLRFLRKTPWARAKVESLYLYWQRKQVTCQNRRPY